MQEVGTGGQQQEPGFEEDEDLLAAEAVQMIEARVALPCFEDDLDAPAQPVEAEDRGKVGLFGGDGGDEDRPAHQKEDGLGGIASFGLLFGAHAAQVGRLFAHRRGEQAHGCALFVVEEDFPVEGSVGAQQGGQVDGLEGARIEEDPSALVAVDAVGSGLPVAAQFVGGEVAAVAQDEVAVAQGEFGCGGAVVFAVGVDGESQETAGDQIVDGLDPRGAGAFMGVADPGEVCVKVIGQLKDGAVLNDDAAVSAEEFGDAGCLVGGCAAAGDDPCEEFVEEEFEGVLEAQVDGLAGRIPEGVPGDMCGQIVATGGGADAEVADRREEGRSGDFARRTFSEGALLCHGVEIDIAEEELSDAQAVLR